MQVYTTLAATLHPWLDSLTLQQLGEAAACFASSPTPQQSLMSALCRQAVSLATELSNTPSTSLIKHTQSRTALNTSSNVNPKEGSHTHSTPEASRHLNANSPLETGTAQKVCSSSKGVGVLAAASLVEVLSSCAQLRLYDAGLVSVCVQLLAREVPRLSPEAVGRLAWSLGMLGCVDHGVLEAVATTALMNSNRFTLQQVGDQLGVRGLAQ